MLPDKEIDMNATQWSWLGSQEEAVHWRTVKTNHSYQHHYEVECSRPFGRHVKAYVKAYSREQAEGKAEALYPGCADYYVTREY